MVVVVWKELKTLSVKVIRTSLFCCSVFWEMQKLKDETPHNTPLSEHHQHNFNTLQDGSTKLRLIAAESAGNREQAAP